MKITNKLGLPQPLVEAVTREYQYKDKQYSVTSLLKGTCQTILERRFHDEIEQDVADMIFLIFGSAVHSILEKAQETDDQLKESYLVVDVNDYKLSGIFDLYDEQTKTVTDYKTATVWKVIKNEWEDYRKQLLMYAWMLKKIGFECNKGEIVAMLKDHSKTKAKVDSSYPPYPVHKVSFTFTENDFEDIKKYISDRFKEIAIAEETETESLQPCTNEERWYSGDKFAVMKKGRKTALRVVESEQEAKEYMEWKGLDLSNHYIEERKGENKKCEEYCSVSQFCPFYKKLKGE